MSQVTPITAPAPPSPAPTSNGLALASMICGIAALCLSCIWFVSGLTALAAIVLGILALTLPNADGSKRAQRGRAKAGIICGIVAIPLSIAIIFAILFPALGQARKVAKMTKSAQQLNQVGSALLMYYSDYRAMPESDVVLAQRLQGRIDPAVLVSPNAKPGDVSYTYIPSDPMKALNPSGMILVYENPELDALAYAVLFVDGHTEMLKRDELRARLNKLGKQFSL